MRNSSVITKGQVVSIISSAGASFHASSFPQLNHSTHLCPFWWGVCRGSGTRPWQIRDYSNGFCHSLGIRFSYESHLFCDPVCTCDSHEWGHSAGRDLALEGWRWRHGVWKGARKQSSHFGIGCLLPAWTMGPFANRSVVCTYAISSQAFCWREEYVTRSLFETESDWKISQFYSAVTTWPKRDKLLLELGDWCAEAYRET